ncbi:uncharacterized protein LOC111394990 [Olea europaea var. sylvestris]|uniref:uncharacterized protein LOC111394990 n=1 Tax=Olea europaea var. sylvestris TaxID=158386 RepID=UPI000C1CCF53|nr:uncharacterized protein LOC111394990 [Olea europaea var. sylvestris]
MERDLVNRMHSVSNNNALETHEYDNGTAPLDKNLDNLSPSLEDATSFDVNDEQSSSHSNGSDGYELMRIVNTFDLAEKKIFFSKKELYSTIRALALKDKLQFRVSRSSMKILTVVCADSSCKWMLRASTVKQSAIFVIRKFSNVHTCSINFRSNEHRHATNSIIAKHIVGKLDNPNRSYDPSTIARDIERELGVQISYSKARRGKVVALHMLHGIPEDSFQRLSSYYHVLGENNPRTVTHIELDSRNRFHYFFLTFGASIRGYMQYLRPVVCIDGSHLKGPYKDTLLLATA